ncbi:MAG: hypothetical protein AAGG48_26575, partial [Planctomycetota bacterium]
MRSHPPEVFVALRLALGFFTTFELEGFSHGELLQALRGKKRERIDPDQLVLFEVGELEAIAEEETETPPPNRRRKKRRGRRLIPDDLPCEEIVYELPEAQRLCPHDG